MWTLTTIWYDGARPYGVSESFDTRDMAVAEARDDYRATDDKSKIRFVLVSPDGRVRGLKLVPRKKITFKVTMPRECFASDATPVQMAGELGEVIEEEFDCDAKVTT